jgi:alanyl-tRNA synthetase
MTKRLYYDDPYLLEFDATVLDVRPAGQYAGVVLDRTAFYPTSGGQPNDLGSISDIRVLDCIDDEVSDEIVHVLEREPVRGQVHCRIDADRRRDHMQQHSGQHVLSQAFVELFDWPTVSFHLGVVQCTIDLAVDAISEAQLENAENLANRIIRENRSVEVRYVGAENAADAGLRKATERTGEIRVIDISGYDRSACGGTHVRGTAEIGSILITGTERAKKQVRVQFICGDRVLRYARFANRSLHSISQTISAGLPDAAGAVRNLWDEHQRARKHIEDLESQLLDVEAERFPIEHGIGMGAFTNRGIEKLKQLAVKICLRPGTVALLADESDQLRVVFARSADSSLDAAALLKRTIERFGGRGGGRPNLAQAGGLNATAAEVLNFAKSEISGSHHE